MRRKTPAEKLKTEKLLMLLLSALACVGTVFLASLAFSGIASVIDFSDGAFLLAADAALCAGCFAGGFTAAKRRGRHGLKTGFLCGLVIFAAAFAGGLIFVRSFSAGGLFTKLLIILICSSVGGIFGVNSPRRFR
ncbi:MAG: TIGR04086 family membrane protein [Prevotella sp.]|nr:TIGR04086 family membrane protein [Prevotella sp.]